MEITEAPDDLEDTKAALGEDGEPAEVQLTWWLQHFAILLQRKLQLSFQDERHVG